MNAVKLLAGLACVALGVLVLGYVAWCGWVAYNFSWLAPDPNWPVIMTFGIYAILAAVSVAAGVLLVRSASKT